MADGDQGVVRKAALFGLTVEIGTPDVPADGRFHVRQHGVTEYSSANKELAVAQFEVLRDAAKASSGIDPQDRLKKEQGFRDILAVRGEATRRRVSQEQSKGGKGGRSGV
jgi:hypothetical protein